MALIKSIKALEKMFWAELMDILGADKAGHPPAVRIGWQTNGSPDWKITDDAMFLMIAEDDRSEIMQPLDDLWEDAGDDLLLRQGSTRVLRLALTAYGPNGYTNLLRVRHALLTGRRELRNNKIYMIPGTDSVRRAPELFQGRWWERSDLNLNFNWLAIFETNTNAIQEVTVGLKANSSGSSERVYEQDFNLRKE